MQRVALFTGTFDPFHVAHAWQLQRAHAAVAYDKVLVAVKHSNPFKPDATAWEHRVKIAQLTLDTVGTPFDYEVLPISNIAPADLKDFAVVHGEGKRLLRIVGADSFIEFIRSKELAPVLELFDYVVVMRPQVQRQEVDQALQEMPAKIRQKLVYRIVPITGQTEDISARNLRGNVASNVHAGLISPAAYEYMKEHGLYSASE